MQKFYHLFTPIALNLIVYDVLAAYIKSFTEEDLLEMQKNHFKQSVVFFCAVAAALTSLLNLSGKIMQLTYCIVVDRGSYASGNLFSIKEQFLEICVTLIHLL
jgi:DNA integrity scanning protein DisA with diadenylate cyclase activity